MTDAEIDDAIANQRAILDGSATRTSDGGTSTDFDLDAARDRLAELLALKRKRGGKRSRHPFAFPTFGA